MILIQTIWSLSIGDTLFLAAAASNRQHQGTIWAHQKMVAWKTEQNKRLQGERMVKYILLCGLG